MRPSQERPIVKISISDINMRRRVNGALTIYRKQLTIAGFVALFAVIGVAYILFTSASILSPKGDVNNDSRIDRSDLNYLISRYQSTDKTADLNQDGKVNLIDISILLSNYSRSAPVSHYDPSKPYTIIMIGWHNFETQYAQLENSKVNLTYRSIEKTESGNARDLSLWDSTGYKYYNNVAGSDWASNTGNACANIGAAYMEQSYANQLIQRSGSLGFYAHEMVSLNAACNGWNWTPAAESLNWALMDQYAAMARSTGKKLIWSEPAQGWQGILASANGQAFMSRWRDVIVPMFATNFNTASFNWVPTARAGAVAAAQNYGTPIGESVQSWYFRESPDPLTVQSTINLAELGYQVGARYYQIEGTWGDMQWPAGRPTTYMEGILEFSKLLESR